MTWSLPPCTLRSSQRELTHTASHLPAKQRLCLHALFSHLFHRRTTHISFYCESIPLGAKFHPSCPLKGVMFAIFTVISYGANSFIFTELPLITCKPAFPILKKKKKRKWNITLLFFTLFFCNKQFVISFLLSPDFLIFGFNLSRLPTLNWNCLCLGPRLSCY